MQGASKMVSTEEMYAPAQSSGCLWAVTKVFLVLVVAVVFGVGFFAGIFLSAVTGFLT
jgi:hypothetical protein